MMVDCITQPACLGTVLLNVKRETNRLIDRRVAGRSEVWWRTGVVRTQRYFARYSDILLDSFDPWKVTVCGIACRRGRLRRRVRRSLRSVA